MSILNNYNKGKGSKFTAHIPENANYFKLSQLVERFNPTNIFVVNALYINKKTRYGESPIALCNSVLINLPGHLTDTVKNMLQDQQVIDLVNAGLVGFSFYSYQVGNNIYFSINWVEITQQNSSMVICLTNDMFR